MKSATILPDKVRHQHLLPAELGRRFKEIASNPGDPRSAGGGEP
jgi:hypothetical protein